MTAPPRCLGLSSDYPGVPGQTDTGQGERTRGKVATQRRLITKAEQRRILQMVNRGVPAAEIAETLDRKRDTIYSWLSRRSVGIPTTVGVTVVADARGIFSPGQKFTIQELVFGVGMETWHNGMRFAVRTSSGERFTATMIGRNLYRDDGRVLAPNGSGNLVWREQGR